MAKTQSTTLKKENILENTIKEVENEKVEIEDMPLHTLRDYRLYNDEARKANKKLKMCRYPIKQCPAELHPKQRVKFSNNDGSTHPVKVLLSDHRIHFDEKLTPGKIYELPECVVHYLSEKGYPVWGYVTLPDGSKDSRQVSKKPRFSITTVYEESNY